MNSDLIELLREFNEANVEYLIVGAYALAAYGHVRATKDMDVWVRRDSENAGKVLTALTSFGAPLHGLTVDDLTQPATVFQIGVPPFRIDILTAIDGVEFTDAWRDRFETRFGGERTYVISHHHLVENKKASGRLQDLADVEKLENQPPGGS